MISRLVNYVTVAVFTGATLMATTATKAQMSGTPGDNVPDVYYFAADGIMVNTSVGMITRPAGTLTVDTDGTDMITILISGPDATATCDLCDNGFLNDPGNPPFFVSSWTVGFINGSTQWIRTSPLTSAGYQGVIGEDPDPGNILPDNGLANYGAGLHGASFPGIFDNNGQTWSVLYATDTGTSFFTNVTVLAGAPAVCGDGVVEGQEQCDDGNSDDTDCCQNDCTATAADAACDLDNDLCTLDVCNGQGLCESSGVSLTCTSGVNTCDGGFQCNPQTGVCDELPDTPAGTPCDDNCDITVAAFDCGISECSLQDVCDGSGNCVPNHLPAGTPCGSDVDNDCDNPDTCDGNGFCQVNFEPVDTPCTPDDVCLTGFCDDGECIEDEPIQCDISFVLPDDAMLECPADTDPSATGMPTPVTGDCPGAEFSFQDVETAGCGNTTQIERVWTYEDDCDNSEDQSQMISVTDSTPPTIACEASTMIAELDEACEASFTFTATGTDACCDGPDGWFDGTGFVGNNLSSVNVSCNQQIPGIMQSVTVNETPGTAIPDDDASGLTRVLNVTESFQIADVRLGIQVTHTWVGDLCITLEHAGTTITVIQRLGDPALGCDADGCCACDVDNLVATFDDAASTSIDAIPCVDGETSGTFIPRELLAAFDGLDSAGDWTLTVSDNAAADTGSLASWGLTIDGVGADPNAEADYGLICDVSVDELADCPADATFDFKFEDCCGNESDVCQVTVDVQDNILPEVMCPEPLVLDRGDSVCGNVGILIEDWFNEFQATDNCDSDLTLSNDAPPCGFAAGTTTVTFSAEDDCGNVQTCTSTVTVDPPRRADASTKGSLLAFPNIELKWEPVPGGGFQLTQDTILSVTNDFNEYVDVHFLFVNGDDDLDELLAGDPPIVVERAHAGWNKYNWTTTLTANQSMYYSMAASPSNGIPPFIGLDNGPEGPGRPDPESANGGRYLRGYAIAWAVDNEGAEIKWDHLEGIATIVHYADHDAWEYQAIAYAGAPCFGHGSPLFDCLDRDDAGTCCSATEIPGQLDFDGFQYAANYNTLLLDFFASGSVPFGGNGVSAMIDTDLSLLPMVQDLRQNNDGPITVKADVDIWNQNEDFFSGTERCVSCWDQVLLSNFSDINNFIISQLGTDKGKARIDGIYSEQCQAGFCCERDDEQCIEDYEFANLGFPVPICSESAPLVGVAVKHIAYSGADSATAYAGSNLRGQGVDVNGQVLADLPSAPQPSNDTVDNDVLDNGEGERSDLIRDDAMRNGRKSLRNR